MSRERRKKYNTGPDGKKSRSSAKRLFLAQVFFFCAGVEPAMAQIAPANPQPRQTRIDPVALMDSLSRRLLQSDSATATLEQWCADHCMATPAKIVARRIANPEKTADAEIRRRLRAENGETIRYRHVQLVCGNHILSEADNWYVPARLPVEANIMLETGDTPFGKAIMSLHPKRQTIQTKKLWAQPSYDAGVNALTSRQTDPPRYLLEHRALILRPDQTPVSEVNERYTRELLDFEGCDASKSPPP